jgi:hypothetical protein
MLRLGLVVVLGWLLVGCSALTRHPPAARGPTHQLTVFCDDFHSGLIVAAAEVDPQISQVAGPAADWPLLTIHFGERRTMLDPTVGYLHFASLAVAPGPGLVQIDRHPTLSPATWRYLGVDQERVRLYRFSVDAAGWQAWQDCLREQWITGEPLAKTPDDPTTYWPSRRDWSIADNCHDFTLSFVRAAGLPLQQRWYYGARQMHLDLPRAQAELTAAGITALSPGTAP